MLTLILTLVATAAALPDPIGLFETIDSLEAEGRGSGPALKDILQDQGVALAEETFDSSLSKSKCMAKELCLHGAEEVRDLEFTPAISAFTEFLTSMKESASRDTKNIDSLLAAVQVGRALGKAACSDLYVCAKAPVAAAPRITCDTLANICPGLSIACTMCGIYAPAVCGPACVFAGLYCGTSGYSC